MKAVLSDELKEILGDEEACRQLEDYLDTLNTKSAVIRLNGKDYTVRRVRHAEKKQTGMVSKLQLLSSNIRRKVQELFQDLWSKAIKATQKR